ncbi:MAG: sigma-54-dependent Fis family transcriptional regulator [Desulfobacterales bacterium]|nr:MAG: sigma-54-dependent Fis family transcriptional regulator [Desulfobacterales bacterium]
MVAYTLFIVDDEQTIREGIAMALEDDYQVRTFAQAEPAIDALQKEPPDLILLDIGLPGMNGIEALQRIKALNPDVLTVMITAYEDIDTVVAAMKGGAHDYVVKPIHMDGLELTIRNALDTIRLKKEVQALQEKHLRDHIPCFIGESHAIQDVMEFIKMVAQSPDTPVLIQGETGTGKELIASAIHYSSPNFKAPLATVNCAAIPKDLIESELFGYEKGAFSGADAAGKKGLIEEAANGTLFLDEVGDLSLEAQAKLLRFLELGEFYRVGGTRKLHIQTRVVSATNQDIDQMVADGRFRKDLYFRLGVIKVQIPSLNERPDDIIPLAKHFLQEFSGKFGKKFTGISPEAARALLAHKWTGHVRELKNLLERAALTSQGPELTLKALGFEGPKQPTAMLPIQNAAGRAPLPPQGIDLDARLEAFEKFYLEEAFKMAGGNESKAAKLLKMNHHTFRYRRKKFLSQDI